MSILLDFLGQIDDLIETGGDVMWAILLVSFVLWSMIIERFLYLALKLPRKVSHLTGDWLARPERSSWHAHRIRETLLARTKVEMGRTLPVIRMLVGICPLLGLLGTVLGMMDVFDVIRATGSNSPRSTAAGVSNAVITTMAGLVIALSGLYFSRRIELRVEEESRRLADRLRFD